MPGKYLLPSAHGKRYHSDHTTHLLPVSISIFFLMSAMLSACTTQMPAGASSVISVTAMAPHLLTFYERENSIEPFAPFYVANGSQGTVNTMGFAQKEGAYYVTSYLGMGWNITAVSNGFAPNDPQWECDPSPEDALAIAPQNTFLARSCADGSVTVFSLPDALPVMNLPPVPDAVGLTNRRPVAVFSPDGQQLALTNDGPAGSGTQITIYSTITWQATAVLAVSHAILSRPSWSLDGRYLAVVDMSGALQIWNTASGQLSGSAAIAHFSQDAAAAAQNGPAPMWTPDDSRVITTSPDGANGLELTLFIMNQAQPSEQKQTQAAVLPNVALPMLSSDGQYIFLHTSPQYGQLYSAGGLQLDSGFALAGSRVLWSATGHVLYVFTVQATEVTMKIG